MSDSERLPRRLSAILYADVESYSRLTGEDEDATHRLLAHALDLFSARIEAFGGRVVHYAGDAILAEFESATYAVACALNAQKDVGTASDLGTEGSRLRFRVGVNLGDVIHDRGDVYGDGVNIAARLETLAEAGGICISESVRSAVGNRLALEYEPLGSQSVKNISEPITAYRIRARPGEALPSPQGGRLRAVRNWARSRIVVRLGLAVILVAISAALTLHFSVQRELTPAQSLPPNVSEVQVPSVAVLPFLAKGQESDKGWFADGITEDIITDLSKISGLTVIAANSTFFYRTETDTLQEIGERLDVRHVIRGTVRRAGERVRINAQLIKTSTGQQIWGERYDGVINDVFRLQDEITSQIVTALAVRLMPREKAELSRRETAHTDAYDSFLQGWQLYRRRSPEDFRLALVHFQQAIELDPDFRRAHAALASTYWEIFERGWHETLGISRREARNEAEKHLAEALIDSRSALALQVSSEMHRAQGHYDEAIADAEKAVRIAPKDPNGLMALAGAYILAGRPRDAVELVDRAMRLDPLYPAYYPYVLGVARFGLEQYSEAADLLRRASQRNRENHAILVPLTAALGHLGRIVEADATIEHYAELRGWSFIPAASQLAGGWPYKQEQDRSRLIAGLLKAGIPER